MEICTFDKLSLNLKENLYNFILSCDRNYNRTYEDMLEFFLGEVFERGKQILLLLEKDNILGVMGVITKEVPICDTAYITEMFFNFDFVKAKKKDFEIFMKKAIEICKAKHAKSISLGVREKNEELETLVVECGFKKNYDAVIMRRDKNEKIFLEEKVQFIKLNLKSSRDFTIIYNEAFRNAQNAATITLEDTKSFLINYSGNEEYIGIIYRNENPIGIYMLANVDNVGWIDNIAILPQYRGQGLGNEVIKKCLKFFYDKDIYLVKLLVMSSNYIAMNLYKKIGFEKEYILSKWFTMSI